LGGLFVFVCVCVCVCVCGFSLCTVGLLPDLFRRGKADLQLCICMIHMKEISWVATDMLS
jgi:hypothetical protein